MNNRLASIFEEYVRESGFSCTKDSRDNSVIVFVPTKLKSGNHIEIATVFNGNLISIIIHNCFGSFPAYKLNQTKDFVNTLNHEYTYNKFFVYKDVAVNSNIHYLVAENTYDPVLTFLYMQNMCDAIDTEYEKFMKMIWS